MKYYAGIGSRDTPSVIINDMNNIAFFLNKLGYTLRSGGAAGADAAFEKYAGDLKEIYLPWERFNNNPSTLYPATNEARKIAATIHPHWKTMKARSRMFHARNIHQVLGFDCKSPVDFVVCWTSDGKATGGTATAINLATKRNIPVYNLFNTKDKKDLSIFLQLLIQK